VGDQVSHPYKTPNKIIILYVSGVLFLNNKEEEKKYSGSHGSRHSLKLIGSEFLSAYSFVLLASFQSRIIFNLPRFSGVVGSLMV
jgi:hypothetical protein